MTTAPPSKAPPRPIGAKPAAIASPRKLSVSVAKPPCPRIVFYAGEKFGKTTFAAYAPDPVILMARGETGYETLLGAGSVPAIPSVLIESWPDLLGWLDALIADPQGRKTLILDAMGGFERLCQEYVCATEFKNEWGEHGFASFNKGYDRVGSVWLELLQKLDRLAELHGTITVSLGHAHVKPVSNPMGAAYDRFECNVHPKVWAPTARWSDCILFGKFHSIVDVSKREKSKSIAEQKGKAIGGVDRVIFTQPCDAFVAGNRYGMPSEIWIESDPEKGGGPATFWDQVYSHIVKKKES